MPVLLNRLKASLRKFDRDAGAYKTSSISKLKTIASIGIKSITFQGVSRSTNPDRKRGDPINYIVFIQFFGVEFSDKKTKEFSVKSKTRAGVAVFHRPLSVRKHKVSIKSTDPDFRFNFEKQLFDKAALIGNWRRYIRQTPPKKRPKRPTNPNPIGVDFKNPSNFLGFSKHVWALLIKLRSKGWVVS